MCYLLAHLRHISYVQVHAYTYISLCRLELIILDNRAAKGARKILGNLDTYCAERTHAEIELCHSRFLFIAWLFYGAF